MRHSSRGKLIITVSFVVLVGLYLFSLFCGCSTPLQPQDPTPVQQLEQDIIGSWVFYASVVEDATWQIIRVQLNIEETGRFDRQITYAISGQLRIRDGGRWFIDPDIPEENGYLVLGMTYDWSEPMSSAYGDTYTYWAKVSGKGNKLQIGSSYYDRMGTE